MGRELLLILANLLNIFTVEIEAKNTRLARYNSIGFHFNLHCAWFNICDLYD